MKLLNQTAIITSLTLPMLAVAADITPRLEMQVQANYHQPKIENDSRWTLTMPNTSIGLTAVEPIEASQLIVHWQAGLQPLADADEVTFASQATYMRWNQGVVSLWAGRLDSLEHSLLVDTYRGALSSTNQGLVGPESLLVAENKALRLDVASGNFLNFSGQWLIDPNIDKQQWRAGVALRTPEGNVSVVYRNPELEGGQGFWSSQVTWLSGASSLSALWVVQDEVLTWNLTGRSRFDRTEAFISYGTDEVSEYYHAGIQQPLTEAVTNYSEFRWQLSIEGWRWSTGFKLAF